MLGINLDKQSRYPVYRQIAEALRAKILAGEFQPNQPLPDERSFSRDFGISHLTFRKALRLLQEQKLVYKVWGQGTFIGQNPSAVQRNQEELNGRAVGIACFEGFEHSHPMQMVRAAVDRLHQCRIQALRIAYIDSADEREHLTRNRKLLSGVLMYPPNWSIYETNVSYARTMGLPVVVMGNTAMTNDPSLERVDSADEDGAATAVEHLLKGGHREVVFIAGSAESEGRHDRRSGYQTAMESAGLEPRMIFLPCHSQPQKPATILAYETALRLFRERRRPTAVMTENDVTAVSVLNALKDLKIKVPDEVELIGFGDDPEATCGFPEWRSPISTVAVEREAIGRAAADLLVGRLNQPDSPIRQVVVPTRLIHRGTTRH